MSLKLYQTPISPPCRATLLTINALGIDVELVPINLSAQEHLTTEFLQVSPNTISAANKNLEAHPN